MQNDNSFPSPRELGDDGLFNVLKSFGETKC